MCLLRRSIGFLPKVGDEATERIATNDTSPERATPMMMTRIVQSSLGPDQPTHAGVMAVIALALLSSLTTSAGAQGPQGAPPTGTGVISAKGEDRTLATSINFAKELGLSFDSLLSLGTRIEQATKITDPVSLASLANELSAYEIVSGKTAKLTSAMIFKDAVDLAEVRKNSAELRAVACFVKDEQTAKRLGELAKVAAKREDAERRAFQSGERTRGITQNLFVRNNTGYQIYIYEDGRQLGWVNPYDNFQFYIGHGPGQNSVLFARSADGSRVWPGNGQPQIIDYVVPNYTWTLD
jgi:hypothetical protein